MNVDAEKHKVTVSGNVDGEKLIKKLAKSGKHAEFWENDGESAIQTQNPMSALNFWEYQPLPAYPSNEIRGLERFMINDNNQMGRAQMHDELTGGWNEVNFTNDWGRTDRRLNFRTNFSDLGGINRLNNVYEGFPSYNYQFQFPAMMSTGEWYGNSYPMMWN